MSSDKKYEEYAFVLDYLHLGKPSTNKAAFRAEPVVQLLGEEYFTLLEAEPVKGANIELRERVYVGKSMPRDKISHITDRIKYDDLTSAAKSELSSVIERIVDNQEERFIKFFNEAQAITPRMHALELLPGIGKKHMWTILNQRESAPFASFKDLQERVLIPAPVKIVSKRILDELMETSKHMVFTRPF